MKSEVVAFHDLGMEAIHAFELKDFPVTVAVDASGASIHKHLFSKHQTISIHSTNRKAGNI